MSDDPLYRDRDDLRTEFAAALGFLTRLPPHWLGLSDHIGPTRGETMTRAARLFPLVGALVGLVGGLVLALALALDLPPLVAGGAAVAAAMVVTGAMHEDGLADTVDGFGGGTTAEAKLAIMRDSRIGTYGASALILSILLRAALLSGLAANGIWTALFALIAAEAVSRAAAVEVWHALPAARAGLSTSAGEPDEWARNGALVVALAIGFAFGLFAVGPIGAIVALLATVAAVLGFERLASAQIAGRTGDTLGAIQQVTLIVFLTMLLAFD